MKLAFIGIGKVGFAIANHLQAVGHDILIARNDPGSGSVQKALDENPGFRTMPVQAAVDAADVVLLATPFRVVEEVLTGIAFNGKTLVDCTNPVGMGAKGLMHGLESRVSGAETVQGFAPDARVVKAFTIYGFENLIDARYPGYNVKPAMLIAGDHADAKQQVKPLVEAMGFEMVDTGPLKQSLHLEHLTLLWVEMARVQGHHPDFVWAYLEKHETLNQR